MAPQGVRQSAHCCRCLFNHRSQTFRPEPVWDLEGGSAAVMKGCGLNKDHRVLRGLHWGRPAGRERACRLPRAGTLPHRPHPRARWRPGWLGFALPTQPEAEAAWAASCFSVQGSWCCPGRGRGGGAGPGWTHPLSSLCHWRPLHIPGLEVRCQHCLLPAVAVGRPQAQVAQKSYQLIICASVKHSLCSLSPLQLPPASLLT